LNLNIIYTGKLCDETAKKWEVCYKRGIKPREIQEILEGSRATYYRRKKTLRYRDNKE
jgi:hypothetical protein